MNATTFMNATSTMNSTVTTINATVALAPTPTLTLMQLLDPAGTSLPPQPHPVGASLTSDPHAVHDLGVGSMLALSGLVGIAVCVSISMQLGLLTRILVAAVRYVLTVDWVSWVCVDR